MSSKSSPLPFLPSPATLPPIASNENFPPLSPIQALPETATSPPTRPLISAQVGLRRTPPDASTYNGHLSSFASPNHPSPVKPFSGPNSRQSFSSPLSSPRLAATSPNIIPTSFVDQSRAFVEQQRRVFEQERLLFAQERELWETERKALYGRIKELELTIENNINGSWRKVSDLSHGRPSVESVSMFGQLGHRGTFGNIGLSGSVHRQPGQSDTGGKFWEGSSRNDSATRTFPPPLKADDRNLHSISEGEDISPGKATEQPDLRSRKDSENSVRFVEMTPDSSSNIVGNGIDISLIEKDLDGISIKASALSPAVVAQLRSPPPGSPGISTPTSSHGLSPGGLSCLTKDAGHTPPAPAHYSIESSEQPTPKQPGRLHRPSIALPPLDSVLPSDSPTDADPALVSPLGITNNDERNAAFLNQLDSKLLQEARKIVCTSPEALSEDEESAEAGEAGPAGDRSEPEVRIRFKRSMNFGSAFGSAGYGAR
ncbi:MAG: hypothetical protein M1839_007079 [Geoglossum umbratile]|nr:MAG: hypothetical protein M1839_007079 [Geoglossum umbratile]